MHILTKLGYKEQRKQLIEDAIQLVGLEQYQKFYDDNNINEQEWFRFGGENWSLFDS